ncbi:MAG: hypothetical protein ACLFVJ_14295 [Persicimonas sp.]
MEKSDSQTTGLSHRQRMSLSVASYFFAALALATLALGLFGLDVPHFPLLAFGLLGVAVLARILRDERAPDTK